MSENCKEGEAPSNELESLKLGNGNASIEEGAAVTKTSDDKGSEKDQQAVAGANKSGNGGSFREQFKAFSKFGDSKSDGRQITLSQSDKWMKQAKVIDGKKITTTDTGIYFKKFKSLKIGLDDYNRFLDELAKSKKVEVDEIKNKLSECGLPGFHGVGAARTPSAVERLTDVSKYTGSHKQRFDNTGKGKGIAGRKDIPDSSGYVSGYQNKDTYNKTH